MGMDSAKLSAREKQPGSDRTFVTSETNFITAARAILDPQLYRVDDKPRDLANLFSDGDSRLGVIPEAAIVSRRTGRRFYVEVKKQGPSGNAEERACKHHTYEFYRTLQQRFGYDYHPFVTVFCESLATERRYTQKFRYLFERHNYFLWANYDHELLADYLLGRCTAWLDQ